MSQPDDTDDPDLSPAQTKALGKLLAGASRLKAAQAAGVTDRQLRNWLREPAFAEAFRAGRQESLRVVTGRLGAAGREAVKALRTITKDVGAPPAARVSAARAILDALRGTEALEELAEEVARLRADVEAARKGTP